MPPRRQMLATLSPSKCQRGRNYHIMNLKPILQCKHKNITGKLIHKKCNAIRCPHGMLCSNARNYINEELIWNQFCNVKNYHIIGEIHSKQIKWCNVIILVIILAPMVLFRALHGYCDPNISRKDRLLQGTCGQTAILQISWVTKFFPNYPPPRRNDYINNSLRVILCDGRDLIT